MVFSTSLLQYWFKSYGNVAEWVDFVHWWSFIGKGLLLQPAQQACFSTAAVRKASQLFPATILSKAYMSPTRFPTMEALSSDNITAGRIAILFYREGYTGTLQGAGGE
jgi:hypothetical protein